MPYRRRYRKSKRRPTTTRRIARQEAKKVISREVETKMFDGAWDDDGVAVSSSGINFLMTDTWLTGSAVTDFDQGTGESQYIGSTIRPTYLLIRGSITMVTADVTNIITLQVIQGIGSFVPGATAVNQYQLATTVNGPLSNIPLAYKDRQRVIKRKTLMFTNTDMYQKYFEFKIPARKLNKIYFSDAAGTVEKNQLFVSAISDSGAVNHPLIRGTWRLFYKDA